MIRKNNPIALILIWVIGAIIPIAVKAEAESESESESAKAAPSGTLPVMYINVYDADGEYDNEVISKDLNHKEYFTGEYWLDAGGCEWAAALEDANVGSAEEPLPLQIKARGNWTMISFAKKPYKIKLDKKKSLLGMSRSKHFALLAHADDNLGYLRNFVGFNLGKRIGLNWTPSQQPIELVVNGDYRGIYFLTETPRVEPDRVDIAELADYEEDPALISGGYLVEIDNYWEPTGQLRMYESGLPEDEKFLINFTMHSPELLSAVQRRFVEEQFWTINQAIGADSDTMWEYLDLDDMARYYIVREVVQDSECFGGSTYLSRQRGEGEKWQFTALWDFGNAFTGIHNDLSYMQENYHNVWIPRIYTNKKFRDKLEQTWLWFDSQCLEGLNEEMEAYAKSLKEAAAADYLRWADTPLPLNVKDVNIADNREMEFLCRIVKLQIKRKLEWLRTEWGDHGEEYYPEPTADDTPAAPLPDYAKSSVPELACDASSEGYEECYYTLQGMPSMSPREAGIYILHSGGKARKVRK